MRIYPSIDIYRGRVVRLSQGRADRETVYFEDPAEPARLWRDAGSEWVHVVDLDGAFTGRPQNWKAVATIAETGMKIELGGGIRSRAEIERAIEAGVSRVVLGTRAANEPEAIGELLEEYGERIAVGIDAKDGKVAVKGWVETSEITSGELAATVDSLGVETIIYTDISRDGTLEGPNFNAQETMLKAVSCRIIASGGVARIDDVWKFKKLSQTYENLDGVIIGKALYEGKVDLQEALGIGRT